MNVFAPVPGPVLAVAGVVAIADIALRTWRPARAAVPANVLFLAIAWVPFLALPHVGPAAVTGLAALLGLLAMVDFSRMVGLSLHSRFFFAALAGTAASFLIALLRHGSLLSVVPVAALLGLAALGTGLTKTEGFLQKLALAYVGVLVYGYLYAHATLFAQSTWPTVSGNTMLAAVILLAKCANVCWLVACRLTPRNGIHVAVAAAGGGVGGAVVGLLWPVVDLRAAPALGVVIGFGLAAGLRAHALIVADVTGEPPRQRKGTMIFGFGLALAAGYWVMVSVSSPVWMKG